MRAFLMFSFVVCAFTACLRGSDSSHIPFLLTSPPASTAGTKETSAIVAYSLPTRDIKCDVYCCKCKGEKAECTGYGGRKVNYLPRLPAKIRDFRMTSAYLWNLTRSMMANLSNFDIVKLTLKCDNISYIEADAFANFSKLELLDLSGNPIPMPELYAALRGISSTSMTTVALGAMELASLPDDFFDVFFNKTFKKVDLQGNHLKTLSNALFAPFRKVGIIDMSDNEISDVNTSVPITTERLTLRGNKFQEFPDLCLRRSPEIQGERGYFRAFIGLQSIHFTENPIKKIRAGVLRGTCLPSLKKLDISKSVLLKTLEDNFIADLPVLDNIVVSQMLTLSRYERYAFNSSSLKGLSLERNRVLDKRSVDITHMFSYCPNLEVGLFLSVSCSIDLSACTSVCLCVSLSLSISVSVSLSVCLFLCLNHFGYITAKQGIKLIFKKSQFIKLLTQAKQGKCINFFKAPAPRKAFLPVLPLCAT